jgi:predicted nucleic acid-binding protein
MTALVFVDTNVLVYAADASEPGKQPLAHAWLAHLWRTHAGRVSLQVLQEYYVTVTRKLEPGVSPARAREHVRRYLTWAPLMPDGALLENAWKLEARFRLSWWDALIVAAARRQECTHLLSEDLSDGTTYDGLTVVSPFVHRAAEILGG